MPIPPIKALKRHKSCVKCCRIKHIREFYVSKENKNGLQAWCISCTNNKHYGYQYHSDM